MTAGFCRLITQIGLVAIIAFPSISAAQGIGLPGQSNEKPIEIRADKGIEWHQNDKTYIARGNARAAQGDVAVLADTLTAYYRETEAGTTDIWRIDANGSVKIVSPTQRAFGDKAVYDVDQGILILTGGTRLETETDRISARDSLEYWENRNVAIARGNASATRGENKLSADVLTAHFTKDPEGKSRVHKVDAFDNIVITTPEEVVKSKRGIYDVETGIATLTGSVRITRGKNQLNGEHAEVNLNTGVSKIFGQGQGGVQGIFIPDRNAEGLGNDASNNGG